MNDEQRKQLILEMKAVTRAIEDEVRVLIDSMEELGQTDIQLHIKGWHLALKKLDDTKPMGDS